MMNDQSMMGDPNQMQGQQPPQQPMPQQGMQPPEQDPQDQQELEEDRQDSMVDWALSQANIAKGLDGKKCKKTGNLVLDDMSASVYDGYMVDEDSRTGWMKRNEEWMKLALLVRENRTYPWPKASNVQYPLLATAAMQYSARAYPALVPSDGKVVKAKVIPYDPDSVLGTKAEHIARHMSYQVMFQMPNWEEDMDKLLMTQAISGICFKKTYHNKLLECHHSHIVYPENFCVNYWAKTLEKAYRKTEILHYNDNEVLEKQLNDEEFLDIELGTPTVDAQIAANLQKMATKTIAPPADKSTPHVFLAQHTFWDLDEDGYEEPYIITIHKETKKVVRIVARWDADGVHKDDKGNIIRIEPVEYFTAFPFIPNPDGSIYALGFGLLLGPLNESVNSIINQLVDAGTLNNLQSGFVGKGLRMKMGMSSFQPGEWKAVNATGDDLHKSIFPLPTKEPSSVLMSLMQMLITSGNQLASIAEIFVGKMPGQNTPATTTQETVKQGMAVFTAIYKRVYRSLESEFKKIYRLNRITPDIVEEESEVLGLPLAASDYEGDDNLIIPGGDPTGDSEATKQMKVQAVGQMLSLGTIDPNAFTEWAMQSQEIPNFAKLIKKPSPPPPDPKMELAKAQAQATMQQSQMNAQAKQQEIAGKQALMQLQAQLEQQKLANEQTKSAMEMQGKQMQMKMDMLQQVLDQHFSTVKARHDVQANIAKKGIDLAHAQAMSKVKQEQAKKPKANGGA